MIYNILNMFLIGSHRLPVLSTVETSTSIINRFNRYIPLPSTIQLTESTPHQPHQYLRAIPGEHGAAVAVANARGHLAVGLPLLLLAMLRGQRDGRQPNGLQIARSVLVEHAPRQLTLAGRLVAGVATGRSRIEGQ